MNHVEESIKHLTECMPKKVSEAELYCSEISQGSGKMVYEDPEGYVFEDAIEALNKQVAKKPIRIEYKPDCDNLESKIEYKCSVCGVRIYKYFRKGSYCQGCGQLTDWSDELNSKSKRQSINNDIQPKIRRT